MHRVHAGPKRGRLDHPRGLRAIEGGSIATFGNNLIADNATNGAPNGGTIVPARVRAR